VSCDYLIIGNVTQDLLPDGGFTIGGTVTYSARTAFALGCRVCAVTSAASDLDLSGVLAGVEIQLIPSEKTMTFENIYTSTGREQYLHAVASPLDLTAVPLQWRQPGIVHLAPLAGECEPALANAFPEALVVVTPQGWMRRCDESGRVHHTEWEGAEEMLPSVDAVVLSIHDVAGDWATVYRIARLARVLAVTLGREGCRVFVDGEERHIPVMPVTEVDPTGAGDIFAAAFFVRLQQGNDPWAAAHFANCVASVSVKREGWAGTPTPEDIAAAC
jgi:sugar/nucleoside kinase (ribokinase family)